jgi:hypothetical protein
MKLTSNWTRGRLFWRTFAQGDTVYVVGLRQGFLSYGETVEVNNPSGFFQMEIKRGDGFGSFVVEPGRSFRNDEELVIQDDERLISIEDSATVVLDPGFRTEFYGTATQFFTSGSTPTTLRLVTSLTRTETVNNVEDSTLTFSATNETGATAGIEGSVSGGEAIKLGLKLNGSVSSKVSNKVERVVRQTLGVQLASSTTFSDDQTITISPGRLTVIVTTWQRRYVTGRVTVGGRVFEYDVTLGYLTNRQISEYASESDLPPVLAAEYRRQNRITTPLKLFWNPDREDNFTTASTEGEQAALATGYVFVRNEGYVFAAQQPNTIPLKLFWNEAREDNCVIASAQGEQDALAAGYIFVRIEGYIFADEQPGTMPLKLFWSAARGDNFTTGTVQGEQDALAAGYSFARIEGHV